MEFGLPPSTERFRVELCRLLASESVQAQLGEIRRRDDGLDGDVRQLYKLLGEAGVLMPTWPREYGGRDADFTQLIVLAEELAWHEIPHTMHFITLQIVGSLILEAGSDDQRRTLLPAMAAGKLFACVLFTEPQVGSDLASVTTEARRTREGWVISGRKKWNLKSSYADYGLCVARTGTASSRYEELSLFLLPMGSPGVHIHPIPSMGREHFHEVELRDVAVRSEDMVGEKGQGWTLISTMFAAERSGLDYYVRGMRWLEHVADELRDLPGEPDPVALESMGRISARLEGARLLAASVLQGLAEHRPDVTRSSLAKWYCSKAAQDVAWWALETIGMAATIQDVAGGHLEEALRDAPGMTISGGASEVLLDTVVSSRVDTGGDS